MYHRFIAIKFGGGKVGEYVSLEHAKRDLPLLRTTHHSEVTIYDRETGKTVA